MIVTVGGQAASGKSTLAKALAKELGYKHISAGQVMRDMAAERAQTLVEFSKYAEKHPEIDSEIDERQKKLATGDCIVDGRLSRYFLNPDLSIWLIAPAEVRAQRVVGRGEKYSDFNTAKREMMERDGSERKRYKDFYGIDIDDLSKYHLVLDTDIFDVKAMTKVALAAVDSLSK
jgi:CMP/dCMP kinase